MDYKDLTAILIKILGAALLFWYITWLPSLIPLAVKEPFSFKLLLTEATPAIIGLLFAFIVFTYPATISNKLISGEKLNYDATFADSIQIIAIRLIGVYHIMLSVTDLVHHFSKAILTPSFYESMGRIAPPTGWTPDLVGWVIASFAELFIALWFVFGTEGILRFIHKLRGHNDF
jgi:hypothetical protein